VVIASKFPSPYEFTQHDAWGSRHHIIAACEGSLRRLGTDYIDLYQMHKSDPSTPVEETLSALDDLVHGGKVRYVGCANFRGWEIAEADCIARSNGFTRLVSAQNRYSLIHRDIEPDVSGACVRFGLGILPYFPLASGLLTGKYKRNEPGPKGARFSEGMPMAGMSDWFLTDANFDVVDALRSVASEAGVSLLHLALGGLAAQPAVASLIVGATRGSQVTANAEAGTWVPSADVLAAINAAAPSPETWPPPGTDEGLTKILYDETYSWGAE
jgi:aryl-alcohol dehydrogenase-like predicted oxidoreductase